MCKPPRLYPREIQVLKLAGAGYTIYQIAQILGISFHTANGHKRRAFRKLVAFSLPHALVIAHRFGLLDVGEIEPIQVPHLRD